MQNMKIDRNAKTLALYTHTHTHTSTFREIKRVANEATCVENRMTVALKNSAIVTSCFFACNF